jgi:DinB superfamily
MNRALGSFFLLALTPAVSFAQSAPAPSTSPVADAIRTTLANYSKNMTAAADAMPADKFAFKPTPEQNSFAHLTLHISQSNYAFCSKIGGVAAPEVPKLTDAESKDKLVAALKTSFDFCSTALAKVDDSHLGESMPLFNNQNASRASIILTLARSWADHYSAQAMYLRLNGVLPPTAQPAAH